MKYSNVNSGGGTAHPRKRQSTISSAVVRCVCVAASCIVTACGLLGLGCTCFVIRLADPFAAPCPYLVTVVAFGVAGLLFAISFFFLLALCRRRNRMRRKARLEDLPVSCPEEQEEEEDGRKQAAPDAHEEKEKSANAPPECQSSEENFDMTQKSADVSLWIEQQESRESAVDCYPLENRDGATSQDCQNTEAQSSDCESEITAL